MTRSVSLSRRAFFTGRRLAQPASKLNTPLQAVMSDACLALQGVICMSCRDACEPQAIRFRPRQGGVFTPEIISAACTGCGACLPPCPAGALSLTPKLIGDRPADA